MKDIMMQKEIEYLSLYNKCELEVIRYINETEHFINEAWFYRGANKYKSKENLGFARRFFENAVAWTTIDSLKIDDRLKLLSLCKPNPGRFLEGINVDLEKLEKKDRKSSSYWECYKKTRYNLKMSWEKLEQVKKNKTWKYENAKAYLTEAVKCATNKELFLSEQISMIDMCSKFYSDDKSNEQECIGEEEY